MDIQVEDLKLEDYSKEELEGLKFFLTQAKKLTYREEENLPDSSFAVVITKKGASGKTIKIRKYPIRGTENDETRVRSALRYLGMPRNQATLRKLGVSVQSVLRKILQRAKELKMHDLLKRKGVEKSSIRKLLRKAVSRLISSKKQTSLVKAKIEKFGKGIKKYANAIRGLRKQNKDYEVKVASLEKETDNVKEFYLANAKIIFERRNELKDFAKDLTDQDLLNEDKYKLAQANKVLAEKNKPELKTASLNVGDIVGEANYVELRKKTNTVAFPQTQS